MDRDGRTTAQLAPKIEEAWSKFHDSVFQINEEYDADDFNTSFSYQLKSESQRDIARIGLNEFERLIPLVLVFNPKIGNVEIVDNVEGNHIYFENRQKASQKKLKVISKIENDVPEELFFIVVSDDKVDIACELEKVDKGYLIKSNTRKPKLFCDFPLIGTETFYFPVIINSFYFHPQTERDGVWLKGSEDLQVQENQNIFIRALQLYKTLVDYLEDKSFFQLYNIANTSMPDTNDKYFDIHWFKKTIQSTLREVVINAKFVELEDTNLEKQPIMGIWFPQKSYSKQVQVQLWQYVYDLYPNKVCKKAHIYKWSNISWEEWNGINYSKLAQGIQSQEDISQLGTTLCKSENDAFDWINSVYKFLEGDDANIVLFNKYEITPNQYGVFKSRDELNIDRIKDDELLKILELLGEDWKDILVHKKVNSGRYIVKKLTDIANEITNKINRNHNKDKDFIEAVNLLSEWFEYNEKDAKESFSELYLKKAELFMNTIADKESLYKVMRSKTSIAQLSEVAEAIDNNPNLLQNLKKANDLSNLLEEFKIENVLELKRLLIAQGISSSNLKTEITEDILIGLGVTTIEELDETLKDKNLAEMFNHKSVPNAKMFWFAQKLISRAKKNVIEHLKKLPNYDCSELEDLANTVIGGVKKDGLSIHIVIRPSDNNEVIVYYRSEKDTLDYENAELWIDNGRDMPRHLTLGKILKTTGIKKIPV